MQELWPRLEGTYTIKAGQEIRLTVASVPITMEPVLVFPINYPSFNTVADVGDTIFIGRYLVRQGLSAYALGSGVKGFGQSPST